MHSTLKFRKRFTIRVTIIFSLDVRTYAVSVPTVCLNRTRGKPIPVDIISTPVFGKHRISTRSCESFGMWNYNEMHSIHSLILWYSGQKAHIYIALAGVVRIYFRMLPCAKARRICMLALHKPSENDSQKA